MVDMQKTNVDLIKFQPCNDSLETKIKYLPVVALLSVVVVSEKKTMEMKIRTSFSVTIGLNDML